MAAGANLADGSNVADSPIFLEIFSADIAPEAPATRFQVELKGVRLPAETAARIDAAIQKAVLTELAVLDLRGDAIITRVPKKEWLGIWLDLGRSKFAGRP